MITAGQTVGNYRVVSKIGTGGMGAVYLAEHPLIGKRVALKVIHRELAGNRDVVSRFFQEAQAVNKVGNEHIIEIHDFGVTPEGDHFYIMEYLEGRTLASVLAKDKAIAVMRALHIAAQIAAALGAAHAAGVVHRDLKPDNIMMTQRLGDPDFVKVLDFGLAKMFGEGSAVKTAAGVLLGTPQYMSPEACESRRAIDHRTDIYALGVLLFQMVTGVLPFDGESMGEVLVKQVTVLPPAPRALNPQVPPAVEQLILRCLAKSVDARFQTMAEVREALLDPESYLRKSPPILPARSIAPGEAGVDAKTVMAYAAAQQQQQQQRAQPGPHEQKTMLGAALPPSLEAPRLPELELPVQPHSHTMRIATPVGYSSAPPPKRRWPIVLVVGIVLGLGGGAATLAVLGGSQPATGSPSPGSTVAASTVDATVKHADTADAAVKAVALDAAAGSGATPAPPDAATTATVAIESTPPGADVIGPDGKTIGKTPLKIDWPIATASVTFGLKLTGYKDREKEVVISGNTALRIELEKDAPVPPPPPPPPNQNNHPHGTPQHVTHGTPQHSGSGSKPHDGVIKPGDI